MSITGKQVAMARILLDLSQENLAEKLEIARKTIIRIENNQSTGRTSTLKKIQIYFENNGIRFTENEGAEWVKGVITSLKGKQGLQMLLDDVYNTIKDNGGEVCLHNSKPKNWYDVLTKDWYQKVHVKRMKALKDIMDFKITAKEQDILFISKDFAEYRWLPESLWNDHSLYSYGSKLAFVTFNNNDVNIIILNHSKFAEGFRGLFNIAWEQVAMIPDKKK